MTIIEVKDLVKRYGEQTAVDGVSFTVEQGEIFGILGPNGAGKTTTVESIAGLRTPNSGTIRVLGLDPQRDTDRLTTGSLASSYKQRACRADQGVGGVGTLQLVLRPPGRLGRTHHRSRACGEAQHRLPQALRGPETTPLHSTGAGR